jgi:hypothetical protein
MSNPIPATIDDLAKVQQVIQKDLSRLHTTFAQTNRLADAALFVLGLIIGLFLPRVF